MAPMIVFFLALALSTWGVRKLNESHYESNPKCTVVCSETDPADCREECD